MVAVHDHTRHPMRTTQGRRCARDVAGCHQCPDLGRGDRYRPVRPSCGRTRGVQWLEVDNRDVETQLAPQLRQERDVAGSPVAEPEVAPDHHMTRIQGVSQDPGGEPLRGFSSQLRRELDDEHAADPLALEHLEPMSHRREKQGGHVGPDHRQRVRVEGHRNGKQPIARLRHRAVDQDPVTAVHSVERPDGDGGPGKVRGDLLAPAPHMHAHTLPCRLSHRGIPLIARPAVTTRVRPDSRAPALRNPDEPEIEPLDSGPRGGDHSGPRGGGPGGAADGQVAEEPPTLIWHGL